jgi:hypothetical protein
MRENWGAVRADTLARSRTGTSEAGDPAPEEPVEAPGAWPEDIGSIAESSMTLPGKGEAGANCGEWYPKEFCDECGEPQMGVSRCEQRTCPNCWGAWTRRRAEKMARRLGAARHAADEGVSKRAVHAVASAPEGEVTTLREFQQAYRDAYELAKEKGVRGGVVVGHGFRTTERCDRAYAEAVESGAWNPEEDGKKWAFVRSHSKRVERDLLGDGWRELTYWSPHFHILGLCRDFEADDVEAQQGWVARRIRSLERFELTHRDGYEDMVGTARYLLSHGTFESGTSKDCVRWFGTLATTNFSPEDELSEGALSVIERTAREVAESGPERGDAPAEDGDECGDCGAESLSPIWDAGSALMDPGWCERIGRDAERRLTAAFEWAIGERPPPPGLKHPRTEEEAHEALTELV